MKLLISFWCHLSSLEILCHLPVDLCYFYIRYCSFPRTLQALNRTMWEVTWSIL